MKWNTRYVDRIRRFSLEIEEESGKKYVGIPVENSMHVEYVEWYEVQEPDFERYCGDPALAHDFVAACKRREMDHLLLFAPGTDRGWA